MPNPRSVPVDLSWSLAPAFLVAAAAYLAIYVVRWRRVRAEDDGRGASPARLVLWSAGVLVLVVALVSPVDSAGEQLASGHMVQHLLLADVVPILLILGLTKRILRPVTRIIHTIERRAGWFGRPVFGVVAYVGVMWFWHIPPLYDATLRSGAVHALEHLSFSAAGLLYWWHLISPIRSRLRLGGMAPIAYMAVTKLLVGAVGVWLAFYDRLLYEEYAIDGERWGMSPLDDQHVAGLIMGLEQSLVMGVALAYLFARMLTESEAADRRDELREERATR